MNSDENYMKLLMTSCEIERADFITHKIKQIDNDKDREFFTKLLNTKLFKGYFEYGFLKGFQKGCDE